MKGRSYTGLDTAVPLRGTRTGKGFESNNLGINLKTPHAGGL